MPSRSNALRGTRKSTGRRRRRTPAATKVRYQRPTARNQRSQILRNTRLLNKVAKVQAAQKVYTDWQMSGVQAHTLPYSWATTVLTAFDNWQPVLRQDPLAARQSQAYVRNMTLNLRFCLGNADYCYFSVFVVTMRRNAAGIDPFSIPPALGTEWIEGSGVQGCNIRLNPAIYKVHYAKYLTMSMNALASAAIPAQTVGDPNTTWGKAQVNIPFKMNVRNPALFTAGEGAWKNVGYPDLPYYQRYYLMTYIAYGGLGLASPYIAYDGLTTVITTA